MYTLSPARERRIIWLLALVQFTVIMDFMVMMPLGPQIMSAFRVSPSAFAAAVSAYSWCSGLSGLLAATYIDRFDRRKLLIAVYALFALSNVVCALTSSYSLLLVSRAFAGITGGVLSAGVMAIVADIVPVARRGAATGIIMTSFSLAAIAGVPAGVLLGAHFGWSAPFWLLGTLSVLIGSTALGVVPSLTEHLSGQRTRVAEALPALVRLLTRARHAKAFALTFSMMVAHMLVIPFISPMLVANHGIAPGRLSWLYMAGGAATFCTSRAVGRLADRVGHRVVFRVFGVLAMACILAMTHLPALPFAALMAFFAVFMVVGSGRMVPMQAILTTVPEPRERGAFLSANGAVQALGTGCGAWLGGLLITNDAAGHLVGYGTIGWLSVSLSGLALVWIGRVTSAPAGIGQRESGAVRLADVRSAGKEAPALAPDA
ncbi:MFS transporter [Trinickia caryophylli]|uniref:Predicted arabinose efflux permease, MFS family n=1 Tax=Trinickia caryophylli TaxID=28094 RepID=A0A1X7CM25_TRICW|nr:MFS transporter [Trinickia caryophylli]PMS11200.1 MFS transporter [Trinickia caryophylli]TRX20055.1 MFS transporter [Trinickia caryophylli]WQE12596.1 MFS transporter [Trinickia caryophylli]SME99235.1 Predicted arabinose efflux permease, MFS family [Trinickia caryophylli]GLU30292.1 MFS transporter [Trinickia caryophylli]